MLDIMRAYASSWIIKVIFGFIILSFILFFGYKTMSRHGIGGAAAVVNGEEIPIGLYRIFFEETSEFYKRMFKDKLPDGIENQIRQTALLRVINSELIAALGKKLGLTVLDEEIYQVISKNPQFQENGTFMTSLYKNNFLPYFKARYGIDYEEFLRRDILAAKTQDFLVSHVSISETEAKDDYMKNNTSWTFERVTIPEDAPEGVTYDMSAEDIAKNVIALMEEKQTSALKKLIDKYKLQKETIEDVNLANQSQLIPSFEDINSFKSVFALTADKPVIKTPVKSGASWLVFKLAGMKKVPESEWVAKKEAYIASLQERARQEYLMAWQEYMRRRAKIKQFVIVEGQ